jgi:cyclopropane fatty-acyl-phospholipid synthase-like methyltransferase
MSGAASLNIETRDPNAKASFRERFMAWWEGTDPPLLPVLRLKGPTHDVRYAAEAQRWETNRLLLVQKVWGEGFSSPGGADYVDDMIKFFGLDPAMSVLDLGAGLGGATRTMCEKFGVWVNGLEADEHLAEAGQALSHKAGLAKRASITAFDPENFTQKAKSVDCVFSKEFMYTVKEKKEFLTAIEHIMKSRGQLLFTDYMLSEPHLRNKNIEKWIDYEPNGAYPWAEVDYREVLEGLHLDIRVVEDITDNFQKIVTGSWATFVRSVQEGAVSPELFPAMGDEVELWASRMHAIEAGDLKVCRIHALKRDTDRLMSDW